MIQTIDFAPWTASPKSCSVRCGASFLAAWTAISFPFLPPSPSSDDAQGSPGGRLYPQRQSPLGASGDDENADDFLWACDVLKDMGYTEVNLNLGCPSGTVTAKGKGSGFLAHPNELAAFFDEVFSKNPLPVSVKTRLGYETPEEFAALLDLYNRYPIACLTVHPRVRKEKIPGGLSIWTYLPMRWQTAEIPCLQRRSADSGRGPGLGGPVPGGHACDDRPGTGGRSSAGPEAPGRQGHRPRGTDRFSGRAVSGAIRTSIRGRSPLPPSGCGRWGSI